MKKLWGLIREKVLRAYKLSLGTEKQDALAWRELKRVIADAELKGGVFEDSRFLEIGLPIAEGQYADYYYRIKDREFDIRVQIISGFDRELMTDVFVLAQHFNNMLPDGQVVVDAKEATVLYLYKCDAIIPLLYRFEAYVRLVHHNNMSKDIYWAFSKLIAEGESPAIIIADLLKMIEVREKTEG